MKRCMWILGLLWLAAAAAAPAGGVIVRTAALKDNPSFTAKTLTSLAPGARVNVTERQGGWQNVSLQASPNVKGWVRTYEVRTNIEPGENPAVVKNKGSDEGVLGGLAGLSRASAGLFGRRGESRDSNNNMVATIGVRGLSEEDLKKAKPSPTEFARLMQYGVDAETARQYAQAGELKSQAVEALAEVQPEKNKKRRR
ncbi:MAG TPA: hypothetical protein VFX02_11760 [Gammaproteobacteria bacterium]|nr:hypothetical protein [Gammaproteobacteria bacterium]